MVWGEPVATTKLWIIPIAHIKGNSILKACWADIVRLTCRYARENTVIINYITMIIDYIIVKRKPTYENIT